MPFTHQSVKNIRKLWEVVSMKIYDFDFFNDLKTKQGLQCLNEFLENRKFIRNEIPTLWD